MLFSSDFFPLNIMTLRFIHAIACTNGSFLFTVWTYHNWYSSVWLFQFMIITNKVALNICIQVFAWTCISFSHGEKPSSAMAALSLHGEGHPFAASLFSGLDTGISLDESLQVQY